MQIPEIDSRQAYLKPSIIILSFAVLISLIYFSSKEIFSLAESNLPSVALVDSKKMTSEVTAYGQLKAVKRRAVISQVTGTLTAIHARPGDPVALGEPILTLANPNLIRKYEEVSLQYEEQQNEHNTLLIDLKSEETVLESEIAITKLELRLAEKRLAAKTLLFERQIISNLELEESKLVVDKAKAAVALAENKVNNFSLTYEAKVQASNFKVEQKHKQYTMSELDKQNLTIKAGMTGVLSDITQDMELGAQIQAGQSIGQIAVIDELYAELDVSSTHISNIDIAQRVEALVKGEQMIGKVKRISPNVKDNRVRVDVELLGENVRTARVNIEVTAKILVKEEPRTLVTKLPPFINKPYKEYQIYVKEVGNNSFELTHVQIGEIFDTEMQILSGVRQGAAILMAAPEVFDSKPNLVLEVDGV